MKSENKEGVSLLRLYREAGNYSFFLTNEIFQIVSSLIVVFVVAAVFTDRSSVQSFFPKIAFCFLPAYYMYVDLNFAVKNFYKLRRQSKLLDKGIKEFYISKGELFFASFFQMKVSKEFYLIEQTSLDNKYKAESIISAEEYMIRRDYLKFKNKKYRCFVDAVTGEVTLGNESDITYEVENRNKNHCKSMMIKYLVSSGIYLILIILCLLS